MSEIASLDVSGYPAARVAFRLAPDSATMLRRLRASDLAVRVDGREGSRLVVTPDSGTARNVVVILVNGGSRQWTFRALTAFANEWQDRRHAGDLLTVIMPGVSSPIVQGPAPPSRVLRAAAALVPDSIGSTLAATWSAAAARVATATNTLIVVPPTVPVPRLRLPHRITNSELLVSGGAPGRLQRQHLADAGALDGSRDPRVALRRILMLQPFEGTALTYAGLELPTSDEGATLDFSIRLTSSVVGLDSGIVDVTVPFIALHPGRVMVGADERLARRVPSPVVLGLMGLIFASALAAAMVVLARRRA